MRKLVILLAVILVLVALPTVAQEEEIDLSFMNHTECEVDLTGQTVTIYHIGDLSGSYAFITQPLLAGLEDSIAFYNEHPEIFCGATLAHEYEDTGGDQSLTQSVYDRFSTLDPKPSIMLLYSSPDSELLRERLAEDEIPVLLSAGSVIGLYGENADEPGWIFATNPLYVDQIGMFCEYVGANAEMFPEPSIGYLSWEGAFGHAADTEEVWAYCEAQGVAHAGSEYFLPSSQDITNQVQNLVDSGATILYTNSLATGPALIASTVVTMGLDVQLAGVNWALDTSVGFLGEGTFGADGLPSTNGMIGSLPFYWWTERAQPGIAFATMLADNAGREPATRNIAYLLGLQSVDLAVELYIQAANEVGIENVTGAVIKEKLENLEFAPLGMVTLNFQDGVRDAATNRIAMMAYLGEDGATPAGPDMPPMVVTVGERQLLIPILVPLTDFEETPELMPGGADTMGE